MKRFIPILGWLPHYKKEYLKGDFFAGITVGVLLIPQGMAYAMIAGLPPVYGLYAAIIPQLVYAIFGTSRQLAVGPVAMDSILVAASISVFAQAGTKEYISLAILLTLLMGITLLLFGLLKLGFLVNFLSQPVISGFTSGAAIIIATDQLQHILGINLGSGNILSIFYQLFNSLGTISWLTLSIGIGGIIVLKLVKKIHDSTPASLVIIIISIILVSYFSLDKKGLQIIGKIPGGLPSFNLPNFSLDQIQRLIPSAITLAIIAFMEAFSISKSLQDKHKGEYEIDANQEMVSIGLSNIFGSLFGSYQTTGSFSRSAVNEKSGAQTSIAGLISAGLIVLTLLFLTPLFYFLPKAILAAIILVAVFGLIDFKYPTYLWKIQKQELAMWVITFSATLVFGIKEGIILGVLLSIILLIYRTTKPHYAVLGKLSNTKEYRNIGRFTATESRKDILIIRYDSQLYFANSTHFKESIRCEVEKKGNQLELVIIHGDSINFVDSSALQELKNLITELNEQSITVYFSSLIGPVRDFLTKTCFIKDMGDNCFFIDIQDAIDHYDQKPTVTQRALFRIATQSNVFEERSV
ncbi:MAG: SulP family inorganic anion transporter [Cyclobacteriaceae bacterium]